MTNTMTDAELVAAADDLQRILRRSHPLQTATEYKQLIEYMTEMRARKLEWHSVYVRLLTLPYLAYARNLA